MQKHIQNSLIQENLHHFAVTTITFNCQHQCCIMKTFSVLSFWNWDCTHVTNDLSPLTGQSKVCSDSLSMLLVVSNFLDPWRSSCSTRICWYCKTLYFRCILISFILKCRNSAAFQFGIFPVICLWWANWSSEFSWVFNFNFAILSYSWNLSKFDAKNMFYSSIHPCLPMRFPLSMTSRIMEINIWECSLTHKHTPQLLS